MKRGLDALSRRLLGLMAQDAAPDLDSLARDAGCSVDVARARLERLRASGVLRGLQVRVDPSLLGRPHEMLVTGSPSVRTDQGALRRLCEARGVTRVFTLASRSSVAFTLCGQDLSSVEEEARRLALDAGLEEARFTLIVNTLMDDQVHGVRDVLPGQGAGRGNEPGAGHASHAASAAPGADDDPATA